MTFGAFILWRLTVVAGVRPGIFRVRVRIRLGGRRWLGLMTN